jgi:ribonuclease P protein component
MEESTQLPTGLFATTGNADGRLHKHADYQRVYKATRKQFSSSMSWFAAVRVESEDARLVPAPTVAARVGLTVGKVIGKAHERNRIKRRLRELVRRHLDELPRDLDLVLHPKKSVMTMDFAKLDAEILRIFRQARAQAQQAKRSATDVAAKQRNAS